MSIEVTQWKQIGMFDKEAQTKSIMSKVLIEAAHDWTKNVPYLIVICILGVKINKMII